MSDQLRDIRELANDTGAYRDELFRRWTGLLSYRYIGRNHSSMNLGGTDDTVTIRRDMRNEAGGLMVAPLAISSPEGCRPTWSRSPTRSSLRCRSSTPATMSKESRSWGPGS